MSDINDISVGDDGWVFDIPSTEPCRLILTDKNHTPEHVWLMNQDGTTTDDLALFAKVLTLDLQQEMPDKVEEKLNRLASVSGSNFRMSFPPTGEKRWMKGQVSAIAKLLQYRGLFMSADIPDDRFRKPGDVWSVDVLNPYTQRVFTIFISEPMIEGRKRPASIWLGGDYPEILDGLCVLLSSDMEEADLTRVAIKIKLLLDITSSADVTNELRLSNLSAYVAYLLLNRYVMHFYMDKQVNVLPHSNVVPLGRNHSPNERSYSHVLEMV